MPFNNPIPRPFIQLSILTYAPVVAGIYGISNGSEWIYISDCDDIRAALLEHLQQPDTPVMRRRPTGFVFEPCDRSQSPMRLDRLVLEYAPKVQRQFPAA